MTDEGPCPFLYLILRKDYNITPGKIHKIK